MYEYTEMRPSCFETFANPLTWNYTGSLGLNLLDPVSCRGLFALFALSFDIVSPEASRHRRLTFAREARIQAYLYTGSLGLNLLDPVSCRGLFALFALSFDIVSPEASRHRRLTFAREARIQAYLYCNLLRGPLDGRPDGRPARVRAPPVCVMRTGPPRRRRAHKQSTSG